MSLKTPIDGKSGGSVGLDLVQIRWQQLREMEFYQKIQQENINLKLEIQRLEKELKQQAILQANAVAAAAAAAAKPSSSAPLSRKLMETIQKEINQYRLQSDRDIQQIKEELSSSMSSFFAAQSSLFLCNKRFSDLFQQAETRLIALKREKQQTQATVQELRQEFMEQKMQTTSQLTSLERRCEKLSQEKHDLTQGLRSTEEESQNLRRELQSLRQEKEQWAATYEATRERSEQLAAEVRALQDKSEQLVQESRQTQLQLVQHYEAMIEQMSLDNQYLRSHIQELEDQIAKLSQALVGNKSHFAKYVEVKTENIALQSRLNSIMKNPKTMSNVSATLPALANPASSNSGNAGLPVIRQSLIAEDLAELAAMTRSGKQGAPTTSVGGAKDSPVPVLPLPRLPANPPRHSLDNNTAGNLSANLSDLKRMGSTSARDGSGTTSLSPRSSSAQRLVTKTLTSSDNTNNSVLTSSAASLAVPAMPSNPDGQGQARGERKKSLRLTSSANPRLSI